MAIFSWRQTGLGDLTDNAEERLRNEINILEQRVRILEEMVLNSARAPERRGGWSKGDRGREK